jgi:hypothetical protein
VSCIAQLYPGHYPKINGTIAAAQTSAGIGCPLPLLPR